MNERIIIETPNRAKYLYERFLRPYFPEDERKPYFMIKEGMENGNYLVLTRLENDEPVCAAFLLKHPQGKIWLLDYFSTIKERRSRGFGSELIHACVRFSDGLPIVIETESLDTATTEEEKNERIRRNAFYQRNQAVSAGFQTLTFGVVYDIWVLSEKNENREFLIKELNDLYRYIVGTEKRFRENLMIPKKD